MAGFERFLPPLCLVAVAAYVSPGLAAFCGAALLVIWGLVELIGVCGSRFFGDDRHRGAEARGTRVRRPIDLDPLDARDGCSNGKHVRRRSRNVRGHAQIPPTTRPVPLDRHSRRDPPLRRHRGRRNEDRRRHSPEQPALKGEADLLKASGEFDVATGGATFSLTTREAPETKPEKKRPDVQYLAALSTRSFPCTREAAEAEAKKAEEEKKQYMAPTRSTSSPPSIAR